MRLFTDFFLIFGHFGHFFRFGTDFGNLLGNFTPPARNFGIWGKNHRKIVISTVSDLLPIFDVQYDFLTLNWLILISGLLDKRHQAELFDHNRFVLRNHRHDGFHPQYIKFVEDAMLVLFLLCVLVTLLVVHRASCYRWGFNNNNR